MYHVSYRYSIREGESDRSGIGEALRAYLRMESGVRTGIKKQQFYSIGQKSKRKMPGLASHFVRLSEHS